MQAINRIQIGGQIGRPIFLKTIMMLLQTYLIKNIKVPLSLKSGLPETIYKSPLDGYFTTVPYAEAIRVGDAVVGSALQEV